MPGWRCWRSGPVSLAPALLCPAMAGGPPAAAGSRPCSPQTRGQRRGSFPSRTPGAPLTLLGPVPALSPGNRVLAGVGFSESHGLRRGGRPSLPGQTPGCLENPHLCRVRRGLVLRESFLYRVYWIFLFPSCKSLLGWSPETDFTPHLSRVLRPIPTSLLWEVSAYRRASCLRDQGLPFLGGVHNPPSSAFLKA